MIGLDLDHDIAAVFYGADFAAPFTRQRDGEPDADVVLILGVSDDEALDGRVVAPVRRVSLPAGSDVRADDVLVAQEASAGVEVGQCFVVLDVPQRQNDGREMEALLGSVQP